jgi:hypothetical protein
MQHPELWGLGLVALGLFLGSVIYAGGTAATSAERSPTVSTR